MDSAASQPELRGKRDDDQAAQFLSVLDLDSTQGGAELEGDRLRLCSLRSAPWRHAKAGISADEPSRPGAGYGAGRRAPDDAITGNHRMAGRDASAACAATQKRRRSREGARLVLYDRL